MTERELEEYIRMAKRGSELAGMYCTEYPSTSYFVLSEAQEDITEKIQAIGDYGVYYQRGGFETTAVAGLTRNPKVVDYLVIFTKKEWEEQCEKARGASGQGEKMEVKVLSPEDLEALQAYSCLGRDSQKNLFPTVAVGQEFYKQTWYVWNPRVYGERMPRPGHCEAVYGVSPYEMSLYLPSKEERTLVNQGNFLEKGEKKRQSSEELAYQSQRDRAAIGQVEAGFYGTQKHCPPHEGRIYLLCNRHLGDVFLFLKCVRAVKTFYAEEFAQKRGGYFPVIKEVIVLTTQVLSGVARLYGDVDEVRVLPGEEIQAMKMYHYTICEEHPVVFGDAMNWIDPFMERMLYGTYELLYGLPISPTWRAREQGQSTLAADSLAEAKNWLAERKPEKMLLLAPYAQTSTSLTMADCGALISYGKERGYTVYTNCSPREKPFEGTEKLVLPLDVCCGLCALGCRVVGAQSGFVDTLRWLDWPKLSLLVVLQTRLLCEKDWAEEWNLTERLTKLEESTYFLVSEAEDLGAGLLDVFQVWEAERGEEATHESGRKG